MQLENFDDEFEKFEDSILYKTGSEERELRLKFVKEIEGLINKFPDNSRLYHRLGLCLYNLSFWEEEDKNAIEIAFHRALLLDQNSIFSKVFLVHFYFDNGNFDLSLMCNELLKHDKHYNEVPQWRIAKLYGLKLCCSIELERLKQNELAQEMAELLNSYCQLDEDELIAAEPVELLNSIDNKNDKYLNDSEIVELVKKLRELYD